MSQPAGNGQERELVYCHQCENEWYRDQHGLVCPDCQSDFTEVIEQDHDPRVEMAEDEHNHFEQDAPDPDEDDIDHFAWHTGRPGAHNNQGFHANVNRTFTFGGGQQQQQPGQHGQQTQGQGLPGFGGGLFGILGQAIQAALQPGSPQPQTNQGDNTNRGAGGEDGSHQTGAQSPGSPGGTFIRHHHGSGTNFSWSITTTSSSNILPRNANTAQPFQAHPEHLNEVMQQMMMNIGAVPTFVRINGGGAGVAGGRVPINLMDILGGGRAGDAVFSQEALDRIVTQLMEQHGSGNAPPPASEQAIESLPRREITKEDLADNDKAECSICMDETPIGSTVTVLPCNHWFHHDCIKAWLIEHDTCPHCRRGITSREEGSNPDQARDPSQAPLHDMHSPEYQSTSAPPGSFPFPTSSPGASARAQAGRQDGSRPEAGRSSSSAANIFARMRDAFGGGNNNNNDNHNTNTHSSNDGNGTGN